MLYHSQFVALIGGVAGMILGMAIALVIHIIKFK
jgi:ABC-type lipoprotein release transport system permease subunit